VHNRSYLLGGLKDVNAQITLNILSGEMGPKRDVALMNAAAALVVGGLADDLVTAKDIAAETIDSNKALAKLEEIKRVTNSL
jgi:anthranilate phosphoribosyltransferase